MRETFYVLRRDDRYLASDSIPGVLTLTTSDVLRPLTRRFKLAGLAKLAQVEYPDFEVVRATVTATEAPLRAAPKRPSARRVAP